MTMSPPTLRLVSEVGAPTPEGVGVDEEAVFCYIARAFGPNDALQRRDP